MQRRTFLTSGLVTSAAAITASRSNAQSATPPMIETAQGKLRGRAITGANVFKGVRYGAETSGSRRFMPPQPPPKWGGLQDAFEYGQEAPQPHPHTEIPEVRATIQDHTVGEDCLRLNIWAPAAKDKYPVMVWFHGGGFASGNGGYTIYEGERMAGRNEVVMVTVNHRLNSFGFLDLSQFLTHHNVGMLDCIAALEWVRDNIAAFGGDPKNVTIFGQSGGGAKVSALLAMPKAKGLFHKAIIQSGSYLTGVTAPEAQQSTEAFMAQIQKMTGAKSLDDLQKLPMDQIIQATSATRGLRLTPYVDRVSLPAHPFSPTAPAMSADVPVLIGTTETEVTFFPNQPIDPIDAAGLTARFKAQVPKATDAQVKDLIDIYRKGRPKATEIDLALVLESDVRFRTGVMQQAELKSAQKAPVYMYYFTWRTPVRDGKLKSLHTLDIPFATGTVDAAQSMTGTGPERYALEAKVSRAWAAFAHSGKPNHKGLPDWPKFDTKTRATMILDNECKVVNDPNGPERRALASLRTA